MAKNITLMGADYPQVPAVQLPQTGGGTATFYDINVVDDLNSTSADDALSANQGRILGNRTGHFRCYQVPANSNIEVDVSNPCFVFATETDTNFLVAYCGSSNVVTIAGQLSANSIQKTGTYKLKLTNGRGWVMNVWILTRATEV